MSDNNKRNNNINSNDNIKIALCLCVSVVGIVQADHQGRNCRFGIASLISELLGRDFILFPF